MPTTNTKPNARSSVSPTPDPTPAAPAPGPDDVLAPESIYARAFARHLEALRAIDASALATMNLDVPTAALTVHAHLPAIRALRDSIVREMPGYDIARFDALESVTQAMSFAHARYLVAAAPSPILPQLSAEAIALRDQLDAELVVLARRKLVDASRLGELKGPVGYKNVAYDLMALAALVRESWGAIHGKCAIEPGDVERAERLAHELLVAVAERDGKPAAAADAGRDRQRAWTLFTSTYDHVRRVVWFLRWDEGDADAIAPSLYAGRGGRRRAEDVEDEEPTAPLGGVGGEAS